MAHELHPETRALLEPWAAKYRALYAEILDHVQAVKPEERMHLFGASRAVTSTNCSWFMYDAAKLIRAALPNDATRMEELVDQQREFRRREREETPA